MLDEIRQGQDLKETVLVGSRPPQKDTFWNKLKTFGIEPKIFDRGFSGEEKGVDAELINAMRDTLEDNPAPGTIAIVAGDQDFLSTLKRCIKKSWQVKIYFWHQASPKLKNLSDTSFVDLDSSFEKITFLEKERE